MAFNFVIFDIDGTIMDTRSQYIASLKKTLENYHDRKFSQEELRPFYGKPGLPTLKCLGVAECDVEKVHKFLFSHYISACGTAKPFEGIADLLGELKVKRRCLAIATSRLGFEIIEDEALKPIVEYFDVVVCSEKGIPPKPHPAILQKTLMKLDATPEQAVYIGDTDYDYMAAKNAGISFIGAGWGLEETELGNKEWETICKKPFDVLALV